MTVFGLPPLLFALVLHLLRLLSPRQAAAAGCGRGTLSSTPLVRAPNAEAVR